MRYVLAAIRAVRAEWKAAHPWTCPRSTGCGFPDDLHRRHTHLEPVGNISAIGYD